MSVHINFDRACTFDLVLITGKGTNFKIVMERFFGGEMGRGTKFLNKILVLGQYFWTNIPLTHHPKDILSMHMQSMVVYCSIMLRMI